MNFLLDTDVCSAHLKGNREVWQKLQQHGGQLAVSVITVGELFTWAMRKYASPKLRPALEDFLQGVQSLDVTLEVSRKFGELRASFFDAGQGTPDMDLLIAATAIVHDLTLVTHNTQDFVNVPGLKLVDWLKT